MDEHIDRRVRGFGGEWQGTEKARAEADAEEARKSRQVRRAEARAKRKTGGRT